MTFVQSKNSTQKKKREFHFNNYIKLSCKTESMEYEAPEDLNTTYLS